MSRGLDNHNPGNIRHSAERFQGETATRRDKTFKSFNSVEWGYRAIFVVIDTYRRKYGLRSVEAIISRWAPPSENHTRSYIDFVCRAVGLTPRQTISTRDRATMVPMAMAISQVENGVEARRKDVESGWELFLGR